MRWKTIASLSLGMILTSVASSKAADISLRPSDMTGLRSFDGGSKIYLLTFDAVKSGTEDRTIAHYSLAGLANTDFSSATLDIPLINIDAGITLGTFDVYSFNGDGIVSEDEWSSGALAYSFSSIEEYAPVLSFDVTTYANDTISNGFEFLSFNFRGGTGSARYWLSEIVNLPDPTLNLKRVVEVPEPSAGLLLATAGIAGLSVKRRRGTVDEMTHK